MELEVRGRLKRARRIVVKVGSRVLVQANGRPNRERIKKLVTSLCDAHEDDREIVFVSSGAIASGVEALGLVSRPKELPDLQMAAAVGQARLMSLYMSLFDQKHVQVAQVLLTDDLLMYQDRRSNAKSTLINLIEHRIIPIINENDVVATAERTFGDNDLLAVLVALMIRADALILMSTTDGLLGEDGKRIPYVPHIDADVLALDKGKTEDLSKGGMASKLGSSAKAVSSGIPVVICHGQIDFILQQVLSGKDVGTVFARPGRRLIRSPKESIGEDLDDEGKISELTEQTQVLKNGSNGTTATTTTTTTTAAAPAQPASKL